MFGWNRLGPGWVVGLGILGCLKIGGLIGTSVRERRLRGQIAMCSISCGMAGNFINVLVVFVKIARWVCRVFIFEG